MLSAQQTAAIAFFGRVQSGIAHLQTSVHQQLSHQLDAVSLAGAFTHSNNSKPSRDVVVSPTGATLASLFVCSDARGTTISTNDAPTTPTAQARSRSNSNANADSSDLLLTALDGVSLHIAGFLDAQALYHIQLVNRSCREFVVAHRETLYRALLPHAFERVVPSSTAFKSYMLSLRHELMLELLHTNAVAPTYAALETYCSHTAPLDHGFIAMFCDIVEFTDARVARFVSMKRHHALSVVLAATADHVNSFRKRSEYTQPVAFVPVCNPNWPAFELPVIDDVPGFLGYAFDYVCMAPGYEALKDTVVKSILRDLMIFDTTEHAAAYGAAIGRPPFAAILDADDVVNRSSAALDMRFSTPLRRALQHLPIAERIRALEARLQALDTCFVNALA